MRAPIPVGSRPQAVVTHLLSSGMPLRLPGAAQVLAAAPGSAAGFVAWVRAMDECSARRRRDSS